MGSSKKKTTQKSETSHRMAPYMSAGIQDAVGRARKLADRPYEAYSGQRIADLSQNEQMGVGMARDNVGAWEGDFGAARSQLEGIRSITDQGALDAYMNPYMDKVVAPSLRRKNEAFEAERSDRRATQGMRNAFGGRTQMWDNKFEQDFQESQDEFMGAAYGAAFDKATGLFDSEQDRRIRTAAAYQGLGEGAQQQRRQDLRDLMSSGLTERTRDQADMDFKFLQFLEERDWDVNNLSTLVSTLSSVPQEWDQKSSSETTEKTSDSPMKTLAGVASMAVGAMMTGGMSALGQGLVNNWMNPAGGGDGQNG